MLQDKSTWSTPEQASVNEQLPELASGRLSVQHTFVEPANAVQESEGAGGVLSPATVKFCWQEATKAPSFVSWYVRTTVVPAQLLPLVTSELVRLSPVHNVFPSVENTSPMLVSAAETLLPQA
jgi:hypothetical protein